MNKQLLKYLFLVVAVAISGYFMNKVCYRTPTIEEVRAYHLKNSPQDEIISIEETVRDGEGDVFKVKFIDGSGKTRSYDMNRVKAWVWPFADYDFGNG